MISFGTLQLGKGVARAPDVYTTRRPDAAGLAARIAHINVFGYGYMALRGEWEIGFPSTTSEMRPIFP